MKPTQLILTAFLAASTLVQAATTAAPLPEFKSQNNSPSGGKVSSVE